MADQAAGLLSNWLRQRRFEAAAPYCRGRVFDCGCGVGHWASRVASQDYVGFDVDPESLELARRAFPQHTFTSEIPSRSEFETVLLLAVIEHVADPVGFMRRLSSLLVDGGRVVLTTPRPSFEWIHTLGAKLGLFSAEASDEHEELLDRRAIERVAQQSGLELAVFERFLGGANQLAVLEKLA
jgi:2-polyprenyl-3-methyl-5-hydroxy-6-metoxy-1,4-benzoquinol methylase